MTGATAAIGLTWTENQNLKIGHSATALGSYVTTNNANTIWVQDQPFADWGSAWAWVNQIDCPVTRKGCAIDLVCQKIRLENASAKSSGEIDELIKRDWITLSTIRLHSLHNDERSNPAAPETPFSTSCLIVYEQSLWL